MALETFKCLCGAETMYDSLSYYVWCEGCETKFSTRKFDPENLTEMDKRVLDEFERLCHEDH